MSLAQALRRRTFIAPPNFLYDRLEGQARSRGNQGNESSETLARSGLNAESRSSEVPPPPQPSPFIITEQRTSSGQPAVLAAAAHSDSPGPGLRRPAVQTALPLRLQ